MQQQAVEHDDSSVRVWCGIPMVRDEEDDSFETIMNVAGCGAPA